MKTFKQFITEGPLDSVNADVAASRIKQHVGEIKRKHKITFKMDGDKLCIYDAANSDEKIGQLSGELNLRGGTGNPSDPKTSTKFRDIASSIYKIGVSKGLKSKITSKGIEICDKKGKSLKTFTL